MLDNHQETINDSNQNMIGMVIQESKCEIMVMPAAVVGSFPYALGITMVPSPKGIAREQTVQITSVSSNFHNAKTPININGNSNNRIADTI